MKNKTEELLHWADEKEVISSNKPLLLVFGLMRKLPDYLVFILIYPISFFFYIFSKRGRVEAKNYQRQMKEFTGGKVPLKISPFKQILSFSLCVMEKMEGWLGNYHYNELVTHDDDLKSLQSQLEQGKGALFIGSHLGNIELLRSLSSFGENGVSRKISVTAIIELKSTEQFNRTLKEVNPNVDFQVIDPEKIGEVVGQRGKTINEIIARTGVKIDITDDGKVSVCGTDKAMMDKAIEMIEIITTDFEEGQIFKGKVVSIKEFGAFIEFAPGKEGMVHISKIARERINRVEDVLTLGDVVTVVCLGKDKMGRTSFSMKDVAQV